MSFQFDNEFNQDSYINLVSLIKKNDGAWRSAKQRKFMQEVGLKRADPCYPRDHQNASEYFGVQLTEGQSGLVLDGHVRWAEYGRKSFRRVSWFFVLDTVGVVAKYKIHFTVSSDGGFSQVNKERTEQEWVRSAGVQGPEEIVEVPPDTKHFGEIGVRYIGSVKEIYRAYIGALLASGKAQFLTILVNEAGDKFYYNNTISGVTEEQCRAGVEVAFTVKKHKISKKGEKITIISRATLTKDQKLINILSK